MFLQVLHSVMCPFGQTPRNFSSFLGTWVMGLRFVFLTFPPVPVEAVGASENLGGEKVDGDPSAGDGESDESKLIDKHIFISPPQSSL